jgi:hypothetical protein
MQNIWVTKTKNGTLEVHVNGFKKENCKGSLDTNNTSAVELFDFIMNIGKNDVNNRIIFSDVESNIEY